MLSSRDAEGGLGGEGQGHPLSAPGICLCYAPSIHRPRATDDGRANPPSASEIYLRQYIDPARSGRPIFVYALGGRMLSEAVCGSDGRCSCRDGFRQVSGTVCRKHSRLTEFCQEDAKEEHSIHKYG